MKKQKGIQRLILRGGGDVSVCGEVGQVVANLFFSERTRMAGAVVFYITENPAEVRLLGLVGISFSATGRPDAFQGGRLM